MACSLDNRVLIEASLVTRKATHAPWPDTAGVSVAFLCKGRVGSPIGLGYRTMLEHDFTLCMTGAAMIYGIITAKHRNAWSPANQLMLSCRMTWHCTCQRGAVDRGRLKVLKSCNMIFAHASLVLQAAIQLNLEAAAMLKPPFIQHLAEQEVQRRQQDDMETQQQQ